MARRWIPPVVALIAAFALLSVSCGGNEKAANDSPSPAATSTFAPLPGGDGVPDIVAVVDKVKPSVASIFVEAVTLDIFNEPAPQQGAGSGVIFDSRGYILTNNHVVENATKIDVVLPDGRSFKGAKLIGRDPETDLAVVQIQGENLPVAALGDSGRLRIGEWVVAIGNALALPGGPTVTQGVVSALGRTIQGESGPPLYDLIQTDAPINPGNSGGPLTNLAGEVVGINTAILQDTQGIGFAISISSAKPIVQELIDKGRVGRPYMGVSPLTVTPAIAAQFGLPVDEGVVLMTVEPGGPADKAGLQVGDVVISMDGKKVTTDEELRQAIRAHKVGDKLEVAYNRGGKETKAEVTLGESPAPSD